MALYYMLRPGFCALVLATLLAAACSGGGGEEISGSGVDGGGSDGDGGGSGGGRDGGGGGGSEDFVGVFSLVRSTTDTAEGPFDSAGVYAAFYETAGSGRYTPLPEDGCVLNPAAGTPITITYRDAGAQAFVTRSGAASIAMTRQTQGEQIYYQPPVLPLDPELVVPGAGYEFGWDGAADVPGGSGDGLEMPPALRITSPGFQESVSGSLSISWTAGDATSPINLTISGYDLETMQSVVISCLPFDDGGFTVPSRLMANLPSGNVSLGLSRTQLAEHSLGGSESLSLVGSTTYNTRVTRP